MNILLRIIMAVIILSGSASFAAPTEEEWQALTDKALDHYYYGRNKEAVEVAREALRQAEELFGPEGLKTVGSIDNLATYLVATGEIKESDRLYRRALSILEKRLPPTDRYLAIFMDYLALFYDKIGQNEFAGSLRARAKAIRFAVPK